MENTWKSVFLTIVGLSALLGITSGRPEPEPEANPQITATIRPCAHDVCPDDVKAKGPVCASDGKTYVNECDLKCWGDGATVASEGQCTEEAMHDKPLCPYGVCPEEIKNRQSGNKECGIDGHTYDDECDRYCYGNEMEKKHDGPCEEKKE